MEENINGKQKLGEIVSIFPGASEIFNKHKIDYCCGGDFTLEEVLHQNNDHGGELINELNGAYEKFKNNKSEYRDWRTEKTSVLIKHIRETHHEFTKKILSEIDPLLFKILKVHFKFHSEELLKVHKNFGMLKTELEQHLVKEEEILFPLIEQYEATQNQSILESLHAFISETEQEHDAAGDILKNLEKKTRDFEPPEGVCTTFKLVYTKLHELEKDLFTHIHLENSILFKRF